MPPGAARGKPVFFRFPERSPAPDPAKKGLRRKNAFSLFPAPRGGQGRAPLARARFARARSRSSRVLSNKGHQPFRFRFGFLQDFEEFCTPVDGCPGRTSQSQKCTFVLSESENAPAERSRHQILTRTSPRFTIIAKCVHGFSYFLACLSGGGRGRAGAECCDRSGPVEKRLPRKILKSDNRRL